MVTIPFPGHGCCIYPFTDKIRQEMLPWVTWVTNIVSPVPTGQQQSTPH